MWVQDVTLHFGLELVLHYSCMDGSREGAGPKLFTPAGCGLRSYQQWDQSGPSAGKSPSSWEGHYSHGVYSRAMEAEPTKFLRQVQENSQFVFFHHRAGLRSCVPASAKRGNAASAQSWCQVRKGVSERDMQWTSCWAGLMGSSKSCGCLPDWGIGSEQPHPFLCVMDPEIQAGSRYEPRGFSPHSQTQSPPMSLQLYLFGFGKVWLVEMSYKITVHPTTSPKTIRHCHQQHLPRKSVSI